MTRIVQIGIYCLLLFATELLHSQNLTCDWIHSFGGNYGDDGEDAASDSQGNFIIAGEFSGNIDIDPSDDEYVLNSIGSTDAFLAKYSSNQELIWAFSFDDNNYKSIKTISVVTDDRIIVCGIFYGVCDFDPSNNSFLLQSSGWGDAFMAVYSSNGELIFATSIGGSGGDDFGYCANIDSSGNYYFSGYFYGAADLDPSSNDFIVSGYSSNMIDMFIIKISPLGEFIWGGSIVGPGFEIPSNLIIDIAGNVIISGLVEGVVDFDITEGEQIISYSLDDNYNCFLTKYTSDGGLLQARIFGGLGDDFIRTMIHTSSGYLIGGYYSGGGDFDPGANTLIFETFGDKDAFLIQLDYNFNVIWSYNIGNQGEDSCNDLALDQFGNVVACGAFEMSVDFDNGTDEFILNVPATFEGIYTDAYVLVLSADGQFREAQNLGGWVNDSGNGVAVNDNKILLLGNFQLDATLNQCSVVSNDDGLYNDDVFVICFSSNYLSIMEENSEVSRLNVYPNPTTTKLRVECEYEMESISITNTFGQCVFENFLGLKSKTAEFDVAHFESGIYFMTVEVENRKMQKVIFVL